MSLFYSEADYENSIIELFQNELEYEYVYGPDIERDFSSPLYDDVLMESLYRLNRGLPDDAIKDAIFKLKNYPCKIFFRRKRIFFYRLYC